jgi:signal transduction histidine kinase
MPGYYLMEKRAALDKNSDWLETALKAAETSEECAEIIADFARKNNADLVALGADGEFLSVSSMFSTLSINAANQSTRVILRPDAPGAAVPGETPAATRVLIREHQEMSGGDSVVTEWPAVGRSLSVELVQSADSAPTDAFFVRYAAKNVVTTRFIQNGLIDRIVITCTLQPIDEAKTVLVSLMPYMLALDFLIALAAAYIFAGRLTRPILKISGAAAMMRGQLPDARSDVRTDDELGELSRNLDSLYLSLRENISGLKTEMEKTARLQESKADFMRAAGHELKTPIAALNGMLEGMIDNLGPYSNHEKYLSESKEQVAKLAELVNEILAATRAENMEEGGRSEEVDVGGLIQQVLELYAVQIKMKRLAVTAPSFDFVHESNSQLLFTALSNLVSNAVKYTSDGGSVAVSFEGNVLAVENTCPNIDVKLIPKLFEPFFTLNYSRSRAESGAGLGLYIVKKNLAALGLDYGLENTDTGLKFSIIFPEEAGVRPQAT